MGLLLSVPPPKGCQASPYIMHTVEYSTILGLLGVVVVVVVVLKVRNKAASVR